MSKRRIDVGDVAKKLKVDSDEATSASDQQKTFEDLNKLIEASKASTAKKNYSATNPLNGLNFTPRYFEILRKRTQLPVWDYRDKFAEVLNNHQVNQVQCIHVQK